MCTSSLVPCFVILLRPFRICSKLRRLIPSQSWTPGFLRGVNECDHTLTGVSIPYCFKLIYGRLSMCNSAQRSITDINSFHPPFFSNSSNWLVIRELNFDVLRYLSISIHTLVLGNQYGIFLMLCMLWGTRLCLDVVFAALQMIPLCICASIPVVRHGLYPQV